MLPREHALQNEENMPDAAAARKSQEKKDGRHRKDTKDKDKDKEKDKLRGRHGAAENTPRSRHSSSSRGASRSPPPSPPTITPASVAAPAETYKVDALQVLMREHEGRMQQQLQQMQLASNASIAAMAAGVQQ